jgi:hypothetical protein
MLTGELTGRDVAWKYEAPYQGVTVVLVFKGTMQSDSEIKGDITASDTSGNNAASGSFTARRQ